MIRYIFRFSFVVITIFWCLYDIGFSQIGPPQVVVKQLTNTEYDCINPCVLSHERFWLSVQEGGMVYQVRKPGSSGIYYMSYNSTTGTYDAPVAIVDDGFNNTRPVGKFCYPGSQAQAVVYWQTDKSGNQDIAFSTLQNGTWSSPQLLTSGSADETNPVIATGDGSSVLHRLVFCRGNSIVFASGETGSVSLSEIFTGTDNIRYSEPSCVQEMFSSVYVSHISARKEMPNRSFTYVYRQYNGTLGSEQPFVFNKPVNSVKFISFPSWNGAAIFEVAGNAKREIYALDLQDLNNVSLARRISTDTTMNAYNYSFYLILQITKEIYMYGPACMNYEKDGKEFISTNKYYYYNWPQTDTLIAISYKNSHSSVSPVGVLNYSYIVSSIVWEDSANGHINIYGVERYDSPGAVEKDPADRNYGLLQAYPNPFNPGTKIMYTLQSAGDVTLTVYDMTGRVVAMPLHEYQTAGDHQVDFSAAGLSSGLYLAVLKTGYESKTIKLMYLK